VLVYELDVLEYDDLFVGSVVVEVKVVEFVEGVWVEMVKVVEFGGVVVVVEFGYMKFVLVVFYVACWVCIEFGEDVVVGVNWFEIIEFNLLIVDFGIVI